MTDNLRQMHSDPAYRVGLEALGRIHVEDDERDHVWRLASDLAGHGRPVNVNHLRAANEIIIDQPGRTAKVAA